MRINRRSFLRITGSAAMAGLFSGCRSLKNVSQANRPNVLFIAVDDLRPELGCYGIAHVISPNIDRLAGEGVVFDHAYCQSAVCNPSRASLLTGLRPDRTKVWDLHTDFRDHIPQAVTLPQYFMKQGYFCTSIGKIYHNTIQDPKSWSETKMHIDGYPFDPDAVYRTEENLTYIEQLKKKFIAQGRQHERIDRFGQWYLKASATEMIDAPDNIYYDGAQTDVAVKKLEELCELDHPFFFGVGYYRPHLPFNAPKKYWDMYNRDTILLAKNDYLPKNMSPMAINNLRELRGYTDFKTELNPLEGGLTEEQARLLKHGYLASVSYIDAQIGKLLDELERLKLRDNTIVVLWGDHGWKLGEHRSWGKQNAGGHSEKLVEFVDIYPTLCELAGLPVPCDLDGKSMVPLLRNTDRPWKKAVFSQFLREGIWRAPDGKTYMGYSVRTEQHRYTEWCNWDTKEAVGAELYDHRSDPNENINVVDDPKYDPVRKELVLLLQEKWEFLWSAKDSDA
jgi:arylsulfatase A-like enzyme